jgi:NAD+ diphosphatase
MTESFLTKSQPPHPLTSPALWFLFHDHELVVCSDTKFCGIPYVSDVNHLAVVHSHYLGLFHNQHCFTAELSEDAVLPEGWEWQSLRSLYHQLGDELFVVAGTAKQIITWYNEHQFCGRCGSKTKAMAKERAMICPECHLSFYPRISPAVIVLVTRGNELLLARSPHFSADVYSTLAGFVEIGETVEETIHREIREEVGVEVNNIRYFSSQSWPFPHSLMLGFFAEYVSGEIKIDGVEIEDAKWFSVEALPFLPSKASIAHSLIQHYLASRGGHG